MICAKNFQPNAVKFGKEKVTARPIVQKGWIENHPDLKIINQQREFGLQLLT